MDPVRAVESLSSGDRAAAGGKALHLGVLLRAGLNVPRAVVLLESAYREFIDRTGLRGRILLELGRKVQGEMRWEEMWDASLRIRHMFSAAPWPASLHGALVSAIAEQFTDDPVAVRSSAPEEDGRQASFAGVHASFVNIRGVEAILDHVKLVWASLFADGALLYADELGIDVLQSSMAVVIQRLVEGECSGVAFTLAPTGERLGVIESVHGLNQGLVEGTIAPDRWFVNLEDGRVERHLPAKREAWIIASARGVEIEPLPEPLRERPPLSEALLARVWSMAAEAERLFGEPQDVEWTIADGQVYALQTRPITTLRASDVDPQRAWYLSLRRSFENLQRLRARVEEEHLPAMARDAQAQAGREVRSLSATELDVETERRRRLYRKWHDVYWEEMIPLAHGVRLFGELYNNVVDTEDPYEFVNLLQGSELRGVERNDRLLALAARLRDRPAGADTAESGGELDPAIQRELDELLVGFGGVFDAAPEHRDDWARLLTRMASRVAPRSRAASKQHARQLEQRYLERFPATERERATQVLGLARASYRLRDDDNLYLGRLEAQLRAAEAEQLRRGRSAAGPGETTGASEELALTASRLAVAGTAARQPVDRPLHPRQLIGQPAGPGVARGRARVISSRRDLFDFEQDEVLVCDAVDPNMTFVVPLAGAVVERRGGMLIHGAIIAREYGLPCVTGVPEATAQIRSGDEITVDGYLGVVTVHVAAGS